MTVNFHMITKARLGKKGRDCVGVNFFIRYVESLVIHTIYFNKTGENIQRGR